MTETDLTENERKLMLCYAKEDPLRDDWIAPWAFGEAASGLHWDHAVVVARGLCERGLLEGNDQRGSNRGYSLSDEGLQAIFQRGFLKEER